MKDDAMRAVFWWIDRWRQSTAFTDMTAEEQGLYRNLCDELWLREDHLIPDDPRILSRVSGDPEAWARCGNKVLKWMQLVDGGWTNKTALEVIGQSERRAEKQRRYRERNAGGNEQGNAGGNKPGSQDQSLSQSQEKDQSPQEKSTAIAAVSRRRSIPLEGDWPSVQALVAAYNSETPNECPAVMKLSPGRQKKIREYLTMFGDREFWQTAFKRMHRSPFLRGKVAPSNGHGRFVADLDWLLTKGKDGTENVVKVHDGKYMVD